MFKTVEEVRYTNNEKDTLAVLFTDDNDTLQEMYIPADGPERKELESKGITEEIIVASTGERTGKTDAGWKENLSRIAEAHPRSNLAKRYGKKTIKQIKTDQVIKKHSKRIIKNG